MGAFALGFLRPGSIFRINRAFQPGLSRLHIGRAFLIAMQSIRFKVVAIRRAQRLSGCRARTGVRSDVIELFGTTAILLCIKPSRMTYPRLYIGFRRNHAICGHSRKGALDRRVSIVTFRRIGITLPANTVKLEAGIGKAESDKLMGDVHVTSTNIIQIEHQVVFRRSSVVVARKCRDGKVAIDTDCRRHHYHARGIDRSRIVVSIHQHTVQAPTAIVAQLCFQVAVLPDEHIQHQVFTTCRIGMQQESRLGNFLRIAVVARGFPR